MAGRVFGEMTNVETKASRIYMQGWFHHIRILKKLSRDQKAGLNRFKAQASPARRQFCNDGANNIAVYIAAILYPPFLEFLIPSCNITAHKIAMFGFLPYPKNQSPSV